MKKFGDCSYVGRALPAKDVLGRWESGRRAVPALRTVGALRDIPGPEGDQ
jgi:hypothetical protein